MSSPVSKSERLLPLMAVWLCFCNIVDGITTEVFRTHHGFEEVNPIVKAGIDYLDTYWLLPKILLGVLTAYFVIKYRDSLGAKIKAFFLFITGIYTVLLCYHIVIIHTYLDF